jgi:polysaccharide export outer membrane protein
MKFIQLHSTLIPPAEIRPWIGLGRLRSSSLLVLPAVLLALAGLSVLAQPAGLQNANTNGSPGRGATNNQTAKLAPATNAVQNLETNRMNDLDDQYKLAIGDHLTFRIIEDEEDPKSMVVTDAGEIEVPYLGRYPVVGKTCRQLATELKARLEEKYYYQATVMISLDAMITRGIVYLAGPVRTPGPMEIPRDETLTLSKAILRAGGFADLADQKHVRVTRDGKTGVNGKSSASDQQVFIVNVYQILNQGEKDKDLVLQPGDLVYIPERLLRF